MNHLKSKLEYLTKVSLSRKIKTKWFFIANIVLAIVIIAIANIDSIIKVFGGDFNETTKVYVIDKSNSFDILKNQIEETSSSIYGKDGQTFEVLEYDKTEKQLKKEIKKNEKTIGIILEPDLDNILKVSLISDTYIDTIPMQILEQSMNNTKTTIAILNSNISEEELNKIYSNVTINRIILDETKKSEEESMNTIMSTVFPIIILPFFMLTIFLVQMIGAEVNDEKTTRGMEIIISNVSPKTHFFSKIIAGNLFVIMQGALLIGYGGLGLLVRKILGTGSIVNGLGTNVSGVLNGILTTEFISKLSYIIPLTLILMLITFLAYSLLAGILASMTTNAEDFGQLQTPIMIISLIGYYLAMMAGVFKGSLFIHILSYIPLISAILAPSLLVLGQIGIVDIVISIIITLIFNYLLIKYGLKIYKVGILNYSSKDLWKKMFKALKD